MRCLPLSETRHPRAGGVQGQRSSGPPWVPAFAGMTIILLPRIHVFHASGGGGTSERPVAASTIEPSAGQYIRQAQMRRFDGERYVPFGPVLTGAVG